MRQRTGDKVHHREVLNEEDFQQKDAQINLVYNVLLTSLAWIMSIYFGSSILTNQKSYYFSLLSCISTLVTPGFLYFFKQAFHPIYQFALLVTFLMAASPLIYLKSFDLLWTPPAVIVLLVAMVVRDRTSTEKKFKDLQETKYKFKGA
ncbi:hypothetical protein HDV02_004015 [Globomyces sp. JEL0801]|nr:hypothetical protein HDV02_004015 [Globomyces sp. JEL0801]